MKYPTEEPIDEPVVDEPEVGEPVFEGEGDGSISGLKFDDSERQ